MSSAFNIPDNDTPAPRERNLVITLCGSARFERLFKAWNEALTMAGHTVFGLTAYPSDKAGVKQWYSDEQKLALDAAHFRKIEASDAIFVINRDAYIGSSTMNEIEHARRLGRLVYFLESWGEGNGVFRDALGNDYRLPYPTRSPIDTTTRSGSRDPWAGGLLGPAGALRSSIVELVRVAAAPTPPVDAVPACKGSDSFCPCQDGDACHYAGKDAWPVDAVPGEPVASNIGPRPAPTDTGILYEIGRLAKAAGQGRAAYGLCPAGCGCVWRDNFDGSMSLGINQRSCTVCEPLAFAALIPLFAGSEAAEHWMLKAHEFQAERDAAIADAKEIRARWNDAENEFAASVASRAGSEPVPGRTQKRYKIGEPLKEAPLPEGWLDDYITAEAGLKKHEVPGVYFVQGVRFAEAHYDVAGREKYRLNPGQEQWVRDAITDAYEAGARAQIDGTRHVGKHTRQAAKHFIGAINDWAAAAPIAPAAAAEPTTVDDAEVRTIHGITIRREKDGKGFAVEGLDRWFTAHESNDTEGNLEGEMVLLLQRLWQADRAGVAAAAEPSEGLTRADWMATAERVYAACGDDEKTAQDCARWIADQQDWLGEEIDDPFEAALTDIEGRPTDRERAASLGMLDSIEVARMWEAFRTSDEGQRGIGWLGGPSSSVHGAMFVAFRAGLYVIQATDAGETLTEPDPVTVTVDRMVESVNGVSWWVVLRRGKDRQDDGKYGAEFKNRAEWHAAGLRWILGQGPKPNIRDFMDAEGSAQS